MKVGEIIKDSLKYPLTDWKKFLIFGIIIIFAHIYFELELLIPNYVLLVALLIIEFIIGLFAFGYMFKIIKSSLKGIKNFQSLTIGSVLVPKALKHLWSILFI